MAEYVNQSLEDMIPELEEMSREGIFTVKETKIILKNRESFEYKTRQVTKTKSSFLNYISYEKKLLDLVRIRRKRMGQSLRTKAIEKAITDRIHKLYRVLTTRFQEDVSLFEEHIEFSKLTHENAYVTRLYEKVLKLHSHKEELWLKAAQWESSNEGNGNPTLAREILLKGHRVNPESEVIFLQMYAMELDMARTILKRKEILGISGDSEPSVPDTSDAKDNETSDFKIAEIVYRRGLEIFPDNPQFHLKLLNICQSVEEARSHCEEIVADLKKLYPDNPLVWNALALKHLWKIKKSSMALRRTAVTQCLQTFAEAVETVPTEEMWTFCLGAHLNLMDAQEVHNADQVVQSCLTMFEKALTHKTVSEAMFVELLSLLEDLSMTEDVSRVAALATEKYPASCRLWLAYLRALASSGSGPEAVIQAHSSALRRVQREESWCLWEFVLNHLASGPHDGLEELMEKACRSPTGQVCLPAKVWSLHWTFRQGGLGKARNVYARLKTMRPINLQFYRLYIQIECSQQEPKMKRIRSAFEDALREFGENDPDVWLNYMDAEREFSKEDSRSKAIEERALSCLAPAMKEIFVRKHTLAHIRAT